MHKDFRTGQWVLGQPQNHLKSQPAPGAAHVARRIAEKKALVAAERAVRLKELWGPIQLRSSVLLNEAASILVNPKVRTAQGLIRLDGIVTEFDGEHCWVQVMFLSPRKTQSVAYERIYLHCREVDYFGLEPTAWMLSDLRRSAIIRSRSFNLNDGWGHLRSDSFMEH